MDLRCDNGILHGVVDVDSGVYETTCKSRRCGKAPGIIVIHRFSLASGMLIETKKFSEPSQRKESSDASRQRTALRSA